MYLTADIDHTMLARLPATPSDHLLAMLSAIGERSTATLVDILSKLEDIQIQMAALKDLGNEEEQVSLVGESLILNRDLAANLFAPTSNTLGAAIRTWASRISGVPPELLKNEEFLGYDFVEMAENMEISRKDELARACTRWMHSLLVSCTQMKSSTPADWKTKARDDYDKTFGAETLLDERLLVAFGTGTGYVHTKKWLDSLEQFDEIGKLMEEQSPGELASFRDISEDVKSIVGMILTYNLMVHRFPTMAVADWRHATGCC